MDPAPRTLYDKLWDAHTVTPGDDTHPALLYVDLHLVHEGTYLQAFEAIDRRGVRVRQPNLTEATTDHFVPTGQRERLVADFSAMPYVVDGLLTSATGHGIEVFGPNDPNQGIVHVIGPELGLTLPGITVVCGDSHTSTHGAFGALAFGIGTTQVGHVLASQCLLQRKLRNLRITIDGELAPGVTAKDLALHILARYGIEFGRGHVLEFTGGTIADMTMAQRMTLCNMSIEMGSKTALIAPDEVTFSFLEGRPRAPHGADWSAALARWRELGTDEGAVFDREISVDAATVEPMVSYGTTPGMSIPISGRIPDHSSRTETETALQRRSLDYMALSVGEQLMGKPVSTVFIGSCTNARIEDLRAAAEVLRDRLVHDTVDLRVVPGSQQTKLQAEREGLDAIFIAAGARWGEPSCSMCLGVNGDVAPAGSYTASTSNRNFEGRQGPGARTILMSPLTAAASAVAGVIADPRPYLEMVSA